MTIWWQQNAIYLPMLMRRQLLVTPLILAVVAVSCGTDSATTTPASDQTGSGSQQVTVTPELEPTEAANSRDQNSTDESDREAYLQTVRRMMDIITPTARMLGGLAIQISTAEDGAPDSVSEAEVSRDTIQLALDTLASLEPPTDLTELHAATIESVSTYLNAADVLVSDSEFTFDAYSEFQALMAKAGGQFHDASSLLGGAQR